MLKGEKGITLVALVITIIVLLILAGVSIAMLTGENGILKRSIQAADESKIAEDREAAALDLNAAYTAYMQAKYVDTPTEDLGTFKAWLTTNATTYMKNDAHYTYTDGKITTKNKNKDGKQEEANVQDNGGIDKWQAVGAGA